MQRYAIILNPAAGRGRGRLARPAIEHIFNEAGATYDLKETAGPGDAITLAREAGQNGYDVIVAAGGDGTIHEVVNGIAQAAQENGCWGNGKPIATLGVIPVGTGNDFSTRLGIPENDLAAACRIVLADQRQRVDLGEMRDETGRTVYFHNHLGGGIEAAVNIESRMIRWPRGQLLFLVAVLRVIPRYRRGTSLTVWHDGVSETRGFLMASAANGGRSGGGFRVSPEARLDDGKLDLVLISSPNLARTVWLLTHLLRGTHVAQRRYVTLHQAAQIVIEAPDGLPVHLDGEIYRADVRRIEAQALLGYLEVVARP